MHKMYECVWRWAEGISERFPFYNRSWFLFLNVCIWTAIGLIIATFSIFIMNVLGSELDQWIWQVIIAGYVAVIMGFGGGLMYILRNTNPDDIK